MLFVQAFADLPLVQQSAAAYIHRRNIPTSHGYPPRQCCRLDTSSRKLLVGRCSGEQVSSAGLHGVYPMLQLSVPQELCSTNGTIRSAAHPAKCWTRHRSLKLHLEGLLMLQYVQHWLMNWPWLALFVSFWCSCGVELLFAGGSLRFYLQDMPQSG